MTLRLGLRKLQGLRALKEGTDVTLLSVQQHRRIATSLQKYRQNEGSNENNSNKEKDEKFQLLHVGAGVFATVLLGKAILQNNLKAEERDEIDIEQEIIDKENRIRQYSRLETIFDYFATYETIKPTGRKEVIMSVKDFYNAVVPWSTITHGVGRGTYTLLSKEEVSSAETYKNEKLPPKPDGRPCLLNEIQMCGMLTYQDFNFLLNLLATPRRYLDIGFHCFDVSADGNIEAKEFAHVMAAITDYKGNKDDLTKCEYSGLMNYLFGKNRDKEIDREKFKQLQRDLMDDILWLEFSRYSEDGKTISDLKLCEHLLLCANITSKQRRQMMYRVKRDVKGNSKKGRITYEAFKTFYHVLFGGADLERAMFFLDVDRRGVTREDFMEIAQWVAECDIDPHIVEVIYALLDDNQDGNLSVKEFSPVLFQWRRSRGFEHATLRINMGNLSI